MKLNQKGNVLLYVLILIVLISLITTGLFSMFMTSAKRNQIRKNETLHYLLLEQKAIAYINEFEKLVQSEAGFIYAVSPGNQANQWIIEVKSATTYQNLIIKIIINYVPTTTTYEIIQWNRIKN